MNIKKLKKIFMNNNILEIIIPIYNEGPKVLKLMEYLKKNNKLSLEMSFLIMMMQQIIFLIIKLN